MVNIVQDQVQYSTHITEPGTVQYTRTVQYTQYRTRYRTVHTVQDQVQNSTHSKTGYSTANKLGPGTVQYTQ